MWKDDATIDELLAMFPQIPIPVLDALKKDPNIATVPRFRYMIKCACGYKFKAKIHVRHSPQGISISHESECLACKYEASARTHLYWAKRKTDQAREERDRQKRRQGKVTP